MDANTKRLIEIADEYHNGLITIDEYRNKLVFFLEDLETDEEMLRFLPITPWVG